MEPRESMVFYSSFHEAIDSLPEENQAQCYRAVLRYALYGEEPEAGTIGHTMWLAFRKQIDLNQKRYENSKKKKTKASDDQSATKAEPNADQSATKHEPNTDQSDTKPRPNVNVNVNENVNENVNVTSPNGEDSSKPSRNPPVPYREVVDAFNEICGGTMPKVTKINDKRRRLIRGRFDEYSLEEILKMFRIAKESDFLSGRNGRWNGCNFDWLMQPDNFLHVLEGNYPNSPVRSPIKGHDELQEFYGMLSEWGNEDGQT